MSTESAPIPELAPKPKVPYPSEIHYPTLTSFTAALSDFLNTFKCSSPVFPKMYTTVLTVPPEAPLLEAFQILIDQKIMSLPVVDASRQIKGIFSMFDFLNILLHSVDEKELTSLKDNEVLPFLQKKQFAAKPLSSFSEVGKSEPVVVVKGKEPLLKAVQEMLRTKAHRVLVVDDSGQLINMITQSRVVALLSTMLDSVPDPTKTLQELNLGFKEVLCVPATVTAFQAFKFIADKKVTGVAVVDDNKRLIGNLSVNDLKSLGYRFQFFSLLGQPLSVYTRTVHTQYEALVALRPIEHVIYAKPEDTFEFAMRMLYAYRIHRIYIADKEMKPVGIISLYDVLAFICKPLSGFTTAE